MHFSAQDRVRWADVDGAGIIYFGAYVRFFELAETELYRAMGMPYSHAFDILDVFPVRAQFHCDFKSPAFLDDLLTVQIWVDHIGTTSLQFNFRIVRAESERGELGQTLVQGYCLLVTVNRTTLKPQPVPDRLRRELKPYFGE